MSQKHVLQRELGLSSIIAISMGAMIGSGIFILPGIAMAEAGPAVIFSFIIAGILVFPAAISIAELGTAMPEAGGDYIFIERGLGPAAGTIAGLGTWLMLMFKGALALVGGMFYLSALFTLQSVEAVALVIGTVLILVNIFGVKQTGGLQTIMVIVMVFILGVFVSVSIARVESAHFFPFFDGGLNGLISATVMVLISYGGVTKVAAVAEEIDNPDRNLPLGLLLSLIVTTCLYALIVLVLVGIIEGEALAGSNIPMADAVEPFFGYIGVVLIVIAAMLALVSTANAGILTASRYPFALSRDRLIPELFAYISKKTNTPVVAILVTGGAMLAIILLLPVEEIAKTAGSFQIVVYILVNVALIAFRVRKPAWYQPKFKSPVFPWIQLFGIVSGIFLLTQMDTLPLVGGVGIFVFGIIWYFIYGRSRVDQTRESVISEAITTTIEADPGGKHPYRIVLPVANPENQQNLLRIVSSIASTKPNAEVICINVIVVPDQTALAQEVHQDKERMAKQEELMDGVKKAAKELNFNLRTSAIVGRSVSKIVLNTIREEHADEVILGWKGIRDKKDAILGSNIDPIVKEAPCRVTLIKAGQNGQHCVAAYVGTGPHSVSAVRRAAELTNGEPESKLTLINIQKNHKDTTQDILEQNGHKLIRQNAEKAGLPEDHYKAEVLISDNVSDTLLNSASSYNVTCIGATRSSAIERAIFGSLPEKLGEKADGTVMIVRGHEKSFRSGWYVFKRFFNRRIY
jgi:amino acid transporter/nucleotide-binding universal stress UspA family protein